MRQWLLIALMFIAAVACAEEPEPHLFISPGWQRGGVGMAFVYPVPAGTTIQFQLVNSAGRVLNQAAAVPYRFSRADGGYVVAVGLLGLYPTFGAGNFTVRAELTSEHGIIRLEGATTLSNVEYRVLERAITMGQQGSNAVTQVSPERTEQAARFFAVLGSTNPAATYYSGQFALPIAEVSYRITSRWFDTRRFILSNGNVINDTPHNGIDYAGMPIGTAILATAAGRVVLAENRIVTGNTIIIEHFPGIFSLYYHLDSLDVVVGNRVQMGQLIGRLGTTGFSTGPHLHFGMRVAGVDVDPNWLLNNPLIDNNFILTTIREAEAAYLEYLAAQEEIIEN